jgi:hypothetical protein
VSRTKLSTLTSPRITKAKKPILNQANLAGEATISQHKNGSQFVPQEREKEDPLPPPLSRSAVSPRRHCDPSMDRSSVLMVVGGTASSTWQQRQLVQDTAQW